MRLWLRRFIALVTALTFVVGGFGRVAVAVVSPEPCHIQKQNAEHSEHAHATHEAHGEQSQHKQDEKSAPKADACFKCCGICTAAPSLADAHAPTGIVLVGYSIAYFTAAESYANRPLVIDPGIPKRIA